MAQNSQSGRELGSQTNARWQALADTVFRNLGAEQGLPNFVVNALAEDAHGFLWVGTQNGLARWDGYRFRIYQADINEAGSLPDNFIRALHKDRQGRFWIGTGRTGLARYDADNDRFIRFPVGEHGSSHVVINAMVGDKDGGLWIASRGGLDYLMPDMVTARHYHHNPKNPASLPSDQIQCLLLEKNGGLWIGTVNGLAYRHPDTGVFEPVPISTGDTQNPAILHIDKTADGQILLSTQSSGAFILDPTPPRHWQAVPDVPTHINFAYEVQLGKIWLGTDEQGIAVLDTQTRQMHYLQNHPSVPSSLINNSTKVLFQDHAGLIWIGTDEGLSRYDPSQDAVLSLLSDNAKTPRPNSIIDRKVSAVSAMPDGSVWLGLGSAGIQIINSDATEISLLRPQGKTNMPRIYSIAGPLNGSIYIGTDNGLYSSDIQGKKIEALNFASIDIPKPLRFLKKIGNELWLSTVKGILVIDPADSRNPLRHIPDLQPLAKEAITTLQSDAKGRIWIGTSYNGLFRYDPILHELLHYPTLNKDQTSLSAGAVSNVLIDSRGWLWVATFGGGVNLLKTADAKAIGKDVKVTGFQHISTREGLLNPVINSLMEDAMGRIWVSTDAGLAIIDSSLAVRALQRAEGVEISSYWFTAGTQTKLGELIFGGSGGLTVVRPERVKPYNYHPPIVLTQISSGGKAKVVGPFNSGTSRPTAARSPMTILQVDPDANNFSVEFSALDYSEPTRNRYAYRLEGYDKDWINTDFTRRIAAYTNLSPGDYYLHLRGSNREGIWSEPEMRVPIRVVAAWYQRWWFILAEVLAIILSTVVLIHLRTRFLRRREYELTFQVQQRTAELHQKQQELSVSNRELNHANTDLNHAVAGLEMSVETLRQLGDIGREITANLDADNAFQTLYQHLNYLLDAPTLMVYRINPETGALDLAFGRDDGMVVAYESIALDATDSIFAQVARERKERLITLSPTLAASAQVPGTGMSLSGLFAPLIVGDNLLGVMSVQSFHENCYGERERLIFHTLCAYAAIALANAEALLVLSQAQMQLVQQEKMASLGQLVASVAHEINTPIGAVKSSGMNIADALNYALENMPPLLRELDGNIQELFLQLIGDANQPRLIITSREERRITQQVSLQLEQAGISLTSGQANILVQLNAQTVLDKYFPLLRHPDSDRILHTANSIANIVSNTRNINVAVDRVSRIIFSLKSFSHVDPNAQWTQTDLYTGIETVLTMYQMQIKQDCELVREYEDIPPILCLPDELNQVWTNLIHNALQAMNYHGTLTIGIRKVGDEAVVSVSDSGTGITPEIRKKIFDPFFTTKPQGEGSGLGLGIVRKIIDKHKGRIELESEIGVGTTFSVYLPYRQEFT